MKILTGFIALSLTTASFAATITGTVKKFSGRYVETRKPYAYAALATENGKLILPEIINADLLAAIKNNKVTFEAEIEGMGCTDMSSACPVGMIKDVKSVKIEFGTVRKSETFDGPVKRFQGRAIESSQTYDYIAVDARMRIGIPEFLNKDALLKAEADLSITGIGKEVACSDMSWACGPWKVSPLQSVEIRLDTPVAKRIYDHADDGYFGREAFVLGPKVKNLMPYLSKAKTFKLNINQSYHLDTRLTLLDDVELIVEFQDSSRMNITFNRDWFGKIMEKFPELLAEAKTIVTGKTDLAPEWYVDSYELSQEEFLHVLTLPYLQGLHTGANLNDSGLHYLVSDDKEWQ